MVIKSIVSRTTLFKKYKRKQIIHACKYMGAGAKGEKEKENGKIQTIIVAWMVRL